MRLLGLDPGLQITGWGVVDAEDNRLRHVGHGIVKSSARLSMPLRLAELFDGLAVIIEQYRPDEAAVEETFVNQNARTALKLGQARGVALLVPARFGIPVSEYAPNVIKKSVVGAGHAQKKQIQMMVRTLLPGCDAKSADAADALAAAICHAHHRDQRGAAEMAARAAPTTRSAAL